MAKKKPTAEKPAVEEAAPVAENNRCFVITPIGDEDSEVRRATDGLIDAVIKPVLEEAGFEFQVAHRGLDPRSITGRIVEEVVESRLVVANLTGLRGCSITHSREPFDHEVDHRDLDEGGVALGGPLEALGEAA